MSSIPEAILVGLADSGIDSAHGSPLAEIILSLAPDARLLDAKVFPDEGPATPMAVAAGIDRLVGQGARVINMSFGLSADREVLRAACARAAGLGVVMLAASPARGGLVFPASYDGVIRVSGDARCGPGEFSHLATAQADFGACPRPADTTAGDPPVGGASFAVAHATGAVAAFLSGNPAADTDQVLAHLKGLCRHEGPERRS